MGSHAFFLIMAFLRLPFAKRRKAGVFMSEPTRPVGFYRRELWVDARDLQMETEGEEAMTPQEYAAALTTRGREKLAENRLIQSFATTLRTQGATYQLGRDFQLGDMVTAIDERLGITVDAVVTGAEVSQGQDGESISLTLGYSQPMLCEILKRKAEK